jgi:hypothetical protein
MSLLCGSTQDWDLLRYLFQQYQSRHISRHQAYKSSITWLEVRRISVRAFTQALLPPVLQQYLTWRRRCSCLLGLGRGTHTRRGRPGSLRILIWWAFVLELFPADKVFIIEPQCLEIWNPHWHPMLFCYVHYLHNYQQISNTCFYPGHKTAERYQE